MKIEAWQSEADQLLTLLKDHFVKYGKKLISEKKDLYYKSASYLGFLHSIRSFRSEGLVKDKFGTESVLTTEPSTSGFSTSQRSLFQSTQDELRKRVNELLGDLKNLQTDSQAKTESFEKMKLDFESKEKELASLKQEFINLYQQFANIKSNNSTGMQQTLDEFRKANETSNYAECMKKLTEKIQEINRLESIKNNEITQLKQQVFLLSSEVDQLRQQMAVKDTTIFTLQNDLRTKTNDLEAEKQKVLTRDLQLAGSSHTAQVNYSKEINEKDNEIKRLRNQLDEQKNDYLDLKEDLDQKESQLEKLRQCDSKIKDVSNKVKVENNRNEELAGQLKVLEEERKTLKRELKEKTKTLRDCVDENTKIKKELQSTTTKLKADLKTLKDSIQKLTEDNEKLNEKNEMTQKLLKDSIERYKRLTASSAKQKKALDDKKQEFKDMERQLMEIRDGVLVGENDDFKKAWEVLDTLELKYYTQENVLKVNNTSAGALVKNFINKIQPKIVKEFKQFKDAFINYKRLFEYDGTPIKDAFNTPLLTEYDRNRITDFLNRHTQSKENSTINHIFDILDSKIKEQEQKLNVIAENVKKLEKFAPAITVGDSAIDYLLRIIQYFESIYDVFEKCINEGGDSFANKNTKLLEYERVARMCKCQNPQEIETFIRRLICKINDLAIIYKAFIDNKLDINVIINRFLYTDQANFLGLLRVGLAKAFILIYNSSMVNTRPFSETMNEHLDEIFPIAIEALGSAEGNFTVQNHLLDAANSIVNHIPLLARQNELRSVSSANTSTQINMDNSRANTIPMSYNPNHSVQTVLQYEPPNSMNTSDPNAIPMSYNPNHAVRTVMQYDPTNNMDTNSVAISNALNVPILSFERNGVNPAIPLHHSLLTDTHLVPRSNVPQGLYQNFTNPGNQLLFNIAPISSETQKNIVKPPIPMERKSVKKNKINANEPPIPVERKIVKKKKERPIPLERKYVAIDNTQAPNAALNISYEMPPSYYLNNIPIYAEINPLFKGKKRKVETFKLTPTSLGASVLANLDEYPILRSKFATLSEDIINYYRGLPPIQIMQKNEQYADSGRQQNVNNRRRKATTQINEDLNNDAININETLNNDGNQNDDLSTDAINQTGEFGNDDQNDDLANDIITQNDNAPSLGNEKTEAPIIDNADLSFLEESDDDL